jgi:hypothetical protein
MPTFDLTRIAELSARISLFVLFSYFFASHVHDIYNSLSIVLDNMKEGRSVTGGGGGSVVSLGCFSNVIGLTSFLNQLFNLLFHSLGFYISAITTVLTFNLGKTVYKFAFKV